MIDAAQSGDIETLISLRAGGAQYSTDVCNAAAQNGHLATLQWLRADGAPWTWRVCCSAAQHGHLEVLQWAHANGAPWNSLIREESVNQPNILAWIDDNVKV